MTNTPIAPTPVPASSLPPTASVVPVKTHQTFVADIENALYKAEADLEIAWKDNQVIFISVLSFIVGLIVAWVI